MHKHFLDFCISSGYSQCVNFVTNGKNILDLILCIYDQVVYNVSCMAPLSNSDHAVINFAILAAEHHSTAEQCTRLLYDWFNADNDTMESLLVTFDWQLILYNNPCAMDFYCTFLQTLRDIISQCVPVKEKNPSQNKRIKCLPRDLKKCKVTKRKLWHKLSAHPYDPHVRSKYRECCRKWNRLLRDREIKIEKIIIDSNNLGAFYRHINSRIMHRDNISTVVTDNGRLLNNDIDKANEFNRYFSSVNVADDGNMPHCVNRQSVVDDDDFTPLTSVTVDESDVLRAINRMKNSLSCPDNLPPVFFKKTKACALIPTGSGV